jgi:hypothetical protein
LIRVPGGQTEHASATKTWDPLITAHGAVSGIAGRQLTATGGHALGSRLDRDGERVFSLDQLGRRDELDWSDHRNPEPF